MNSKEYKEQHNIYKKQNEEMEKTLKEIKQREEEYKSPTREHENREYRTNKAIKGNHPKFSRKRKAILS